MIKMCSHLRCKTQTHSFAESGHDYTVCLMWLNPADYMQKWVHVLFNLPDCAPSKAFLLLPALRKMMGVSSWTHEETESISVRLLWVWAITAASYLQVISIDVVLLISMKHLILLGYFKKVNFPCNCCHF